MHRYHLLIASSALCLTLSAFTAQAQTEGGFSGPGIQQTTQGGFAGPSVEGNVSTVEQVQNMRDDTRIALRGNVIEHLGGDNYLFKDATGTITVDIDHDKWAGQIVKPENLVEIRGKVDRDWNSIEIDVKSIRIIQ